MKDAKWASIHFLHLKEPGIDIDSCHLELTEISINCSNITRYRKAFRVKIRTLIKESDSDSLKECFDKFYSLAEFTHALYGHHSCDEEVGYWQKKVALSLQKEYKQVSSSHVLGKRVEYKDVDLYEEYFKRRYKILYPLAKEPITFIQDKRPFLTLKDYAHLERWYKYDALYDANRTGSGSLI